MDNKYVLFVFTDPSKVVPQKLYYIDGVKFTGNKKDAPSYEMKEAYKIQIENRMFDLQIEEV